MIQITADTRRAVVTNKELLTVGSAGIQVEFTLSEDWDGLSKLAVFRVGDEGRKVDVALGIDLTCVVPPEVLTEEGEVLFIGIYGANESGSIIIPTIWASAGVVKPGTEPNTPASAEPTPVIWAQILGVATDAEQTAAAAMSNVEAGLQELSGLENTVQNAEDQRQANELVRIANETDRVAAETERSSAENSREVAETGRGNAELTRGINESKRQTAEQTRVTNENTRRSNENTRQSNEATRLYNEVQRQEYEQYRREAETSRYKAENARQWNSANFLRDGVSATTLPAGSDATVDTTWITNQSISGTGTIGSVSFGIPAGEPGTTDAGEIEFDDSETYPAGSIGAEVSDAKNAISQLQPAATQSDVGKALIVKTVDTQTGKPSSYEYGEAGGQTDIGLSVVNGQICVSYSV